MYLSHLQDHTISGKNQKRKKHAAGIEMVSGIRQFGKAIRFYAVKLPFIYLMIGLGFVFEFLLTYPFMILVTIDERRQAGRKYSNAASATRYPEDV